MEITAVNNTFTDISIVQEFQSFLHKVWISGNRRSTFYDKNSLKADTNLHSFISEPLRLMQVFQWVISLNQKKLAITEDKLDNFITEGSESLAQLGEDITLDVY